jgi:hypothetical protein
VSFLGIEELNLQEFDDKGLSWWFIERNILLLKTLLELFKDMTIFTCVIKLSSKLLMRIIAVVYSFLGLWLWLGMDLYVTVLIGFGVSAWRWFNLMPIRGRLVYTGTILIFFITNRTLFFLTNAFFFKLSSDVSIYLCFLISET